MRFDLARIFAFLLVCSGGIGTFWALLGLYRRGERPGEGSDTRGPWSFAPAAEGRASMLALALASLLGLFLELLLIRWVSSEIRVFAYFKNFVLIACFLGFGLGFHLSRRRVQPLALLLPLGLLWAVIQVPWEPLRNLVDRLPLYLGAFSEVHVWGVPAFSLSGPVVLGFTGALVISVALFGLIAITFVPIGQLIGRHIEASTAGIRAYSVNLLASLGGVLLFSALSFLGQPPVVWFLLAGAMAAALFWRHPSLRWATVGVFAACCALLALLPTDSGTVYWSPYQKLALSPVDQGGERIAYGLTTNNSWYQRIIDLSDDFLARHPDLLGGVPRALSSYDLPYRFSEKPSSVLVLGSGMGNDVAAALRNGAGRVTAVEIDPVILELGRELHFEHPYSDPRVTAVVDDARAYLEASRERFDLIVFALLDSHTTASHFSNIRIDNYVYTLEALTQARSLLAPGGVLVIKFQVETPWIAGRLKALLTETFGFPPLRVTVRPSYSTTGSFFVTGSRERLAAALEDPDLAGFLADLPVMPIEPAVPTTDDWPFFYQQAPGLPLAAVILPALLVAACLVALRRVGVGRSALSGHFFFLGAGFLLLEVHIVSKLALLFGTTWVVNSVVVSGILLLVVGANLLVERVPSFPAPVAWGGLVATLLLSYALPLEWLFFESPWLRAVAATWVLCLPVFFAGIVFIRSFAAVGFRGEALGSNLLGALVGGMLESLSQWTGLRSMALLALALYLTAYLLRRGRQPGSTPASDVVT
jgi:SAM-dependent methyltransferase